MTLFCKPACWLYGLKIRHIDQKVRWIHDRYRLSETALRWRDDRAKQALKCHSAEELPDHPRLTRIQLQELKRLCGMSREQLRKERLRLTEEHRRLQDRRGKLIARQRRRGGAPVLQLVSALETRF